MRRNAESCWKISSFGTLMVLSYRYWRQVILESEKYGSDWQDLDDVLCYWFQCIPKSFALLQARRLGCSLCSFDWTSDFRYVREIDWGLMPTSIQLNLCLDLRLRLKWLRFWRCGNSGFPSCGCFQKRLVSDQSSISVGKDLSFGFVSLVIFPHTSNSYGISKLKGQNYAPLRRDNSSGLSINQVLQAAFQILTFEKVHRINKLHRHEHWSMFRFHRKDTPNCWERLSLGQTTYTLD